MSCGIPKNDACCSAVDGILISAGPTFGDYNPEGGLHMKENSPLQRECPFQVYHYYKCEKTFIILG